MYAVFSHVAATFARKFLKMKKERFEMFTDAVIAIIMTLMILEIKLPDITAANFSILTQQISIYALSFIVIAIAWLNHHIMFLHIEKVTTKIIWINFAMLFSMSIIPLATKPLGEHFFQKESHMFYGAVMTAVVLPYTLLQLNANKMLTKLQGKDKNHINQLNWLSTVVYGLSIPLSLLSIYISTIIFVMLPIIYFIPSKKLTNLR